MRERRRTTADAATVAFGLSLVVLFPVIAALSSSAHPLAAPACAAAAQIGIGGAPCMIAVAFAWLARESDHFRPGAAAAMRRWRGELGCGSMRSARALEAFSCFPHDRSRDLRHDWCSVSICDPRADIVYSTRASWSSLLVSCDLQSSATMHGEA